MDSAVDHHSDERADELAPGELAAILRAAAGGDERAWRRVLEMYGKRVFALARSRLRRADLAEEITQSVFVTVASKLRPEPSLGTDSAVGTYTEQGKFEAWLFRVAVNRIRDEVRKLRRHATPTDPEILGGIAGSTGNTSAGRTVEQEAQFTALRTAMDRLSEADREIIELRHHAGMSFAQMAQMLGEPLGTLLARHHRALRKLKATLDPDGASEERESE